MADIKVFDSPEFGQVRTVLVDGQPWFVGKDVASALGYEKPTDAVRKRCDDEDRGISKMETPSGAQDMTIINESGLYSLVLSSKLESAKRFKRWVTSEVLPSIRQTGGYIKADGLTDEEIMAKAVLIGQKTIERLKQENAKLKPAADYAKRLLLAEGCVTTTQIAKDYGWSAQKLNTILKGLGVLWKVGGQWVLKTQHTGKGYTESRTIEITHRDGTVSVKMETVWTQKGRLFIDTKLRKGGFVE